MKRSLFVCVFALLAVAVVVSSEAFAGTTGKIAGRITASENGEPLMGTNIIIEGTRLGAASGKDGYYFVNNIPPGIYTVVVRMIGYKTVRMQNVRVSIDLTTEINFRLEPEALETGEVVIVAERPKIQKDLTSTSAVVSSQEIKLIPVENFNEVVNLQAGVVDGHFRGGRRGEVAYLVDGISVTDAFNGGVGIEIENTSIREMEVISGTFNAEYGQAMSGVVNIVTKDGSDKFEGDFSGYVGNYLTRHDELFPHLDRLDGTGFQNVQVTLSGPVRPIAGLTFFWTGRFFNDEGHIFGERVYLPQDANPFAPSGDFEAVPTNTYKKYSLHGKLTYSFGGNLKLSYTAMWDNNRNRYYDHGYRWTPDGTMHHFRDNWHHDFIATQTLSPRVFHSLKLARNYSNYKGYLYEDAFDPRYVDPLQGLPTSGYTFRYGGNQGDRYRRYIYTDIAQWSLTAQVTREHKLGFGIEAKRHKIYNHWQEMRNLDEGQTDENGNPIFTLGYAQGGTPYNQNYTKRPFEFAAYLQDKLEYHQFIFNMGVRFDYFDPNSELPSDAKNPHGNPLFPFGFKDAKAKHQVSPRLGCSFPISDQGAIHFSYGHFFQIPRFENLYLNSQGWQIAKGRGLYTVLGNPDLKAEQTTMYEVGLQQVLYGNLILDYTMYYRDIRNLLGTEVIESYDKEQYARYINRDYGNVRGFLISLEKRFANHFSATIDYTYQIAEGNSSDPRSVFQDNQTDPPLQSEKKVVPLDWDQRSTLNLSLIVGTPGNWTVGLIGRLGSGQPYTKDFQRTNDIRFENNGRKPNTATFDLRAEKSFKVLGTRLQSFLLVYNLFDRKNELGVYATTGRANYDLNVQYAGEIFGLNTYEEYLNNPGMYSTPRELRAGFSFAF